MFTNITNEAFVKQGQQIFLCSTYMDNILIHLSECWWGGKGLIAEYNEAIICFVAVDIIEYHCFIQSLRIQRDKCKKVSCELQDDNLNFETFGTPHFNKNNLKCDTPSSALHSGLDNKLYKWVDLDHKNTVC